MKIPLSWLKEYIEINLSPEQIAKKLTLAGLEVDAIDKMASGFSGVVVAKVVETQKHPGADALTIAQVTDGEQTFQVVCAASNCRSGMMTAFARVGASLTAEDGKSFKIKQAKLRGVESFGMLCAADELGLPGDKSGIIEFPEHFKVGTDVSELYTDTVFDISLTPNLGHCSSVIGVARELSAATGIPYRLPKVSLEEDPSLAAAKLISVKVLNPEGCPRYACRVVQGVSVGPSPDWLRERLEAGGLRPVNTIVDVTNYVMLELGHPLHAFDADRLMGNQIIVKNAQKGDHFVTLDNKDRILEAGDLLICDSDKAVALAGVMGGINSEVEAGTKTVVLEAASFAPGMIRRTSKRLGLSSDASKRFERGCDPNILKVVLDRAAMLIQQVAGGKVSTGIVDVVMKPFERKRISCRLSRINKVLGTHLSVDEVENIFKRLELISKWDGNDTFLVEPPTYRNDLKEEIDLVEEVARIYGYENISKPATFYQSSTIPHNPVFLFEREVRTRLVCEGLQEFLTCDLIGPAILNIVQEKEMAEQSWVKVLNPTSIEQSILRTSMLPGLLQVVKYNWDHQNQEIAGFEIGRIHFKEGTKYLEQSVVGIVLSGKSRPHHWDDKPKDADFFDLKGMIENLLSEMRVSDLTFKASTLSTLHPGRQTALYSGELKIGSLGEVHPALVRRLDVPQRIYFAEVNLESLMQVRSPIAQMKPLPVYPGSERDWTLTLKEHKPIDDIFNAVYAMSSKYLEKVSLQDIYRSEKLGHDLKNVTFRFFYRDQGKTIEQEKVDAEHARIVDSVSKTIIK